jgi:hypothetical protein
VTLCYEAGYDGFWLARFLEGKQLLRQEIPLATVSCDDLTDENDLIRLKIFNLAFIASVFEASFEM